MDIDDIIKGCIGDLTKKFPYSSREKAFELFSEIAERSPRKGLDWSEKLVGRLALVADVARGDLSRLEELREVYRSVKEYLFDSEKRLLSILVNSSWSGQDSISREDYAGKRRGRDTGSGRWSEGQRYNRGKTFG